MVRCLVLGGAPVRSCFERLMAGSRMGGVGYTYGLVPVKSYIFVNMRGCHSIITDSSERRGYPVRRWFGSVSSRIRQSVVDILSVGGLAQGSLFKLLFAFARSNDHRSFDPGNNQLIPRC